MTLHRLSKEQMDEIVRRYAERMRNTPEDDYVDASADVPRRRIVTDPLDVSGEGDRFQADGLEFRRMPREEQDWQDAKNPHPLRRIVTDPLDLTTKPEEDWQDAKNPHPLRRIVTDPLDLRPMYGPEQRKVGGRGGISVRPTKSASLPADAGMVDSLANYVSPDALNPDAVKEYVASRMSPDMDNSRRRSRSNGIDVLLGRKLSESGAGVAGEKFNPDFYDNLEQSIDRNHKLDVEARNEDRQDMLDRRSGEKHRLDMAEGNAKLASDQVKARIASEENDPNSPTSQAARALIAPKFGNQPGFNGLSASVIVKQLPWMREVLENELKREELRSLERRNNADNASAERQAKIRAESSGDFGAAMNKFADIKGQELDLKKDQLNIPGLKHASGSAPTLDDAKQVKNFLDAGRNVLGFFDKVEKTWNKSGPEFGFGSARADMQANHGNILGEMAKLLGAGVLQQHDIEFIKGVIGDPTSLNALRPGDFAQRMKTIRDSIRTRARSKVLSHNFDFDTMNDATLSLGGGPSATGSPAGKTLVTKQFFPKANKTVLRYSDGTEEAVDGRQ